MESTSAPQIRIGDWVSEGWRMFVQQWKQWVLITLVFFLATMAPYGLLALGFLIVVLGSIEPGGGMASGGAAGAILFFYVALFGVTILMLPVHAFFSAGMYRVAFKQLKGGEIELRDLFSGGDCFLRMLGATIIIAVIVFVGVLLCIIPGYIAMGMLFFTGPLVVERRLSVFEALGTSWELGKQNILMFTLFALLVGLIAGAGSYACYVGLLATIPLQYTISAIAYRDCFGVPGATSFRAPAPGAPAYGVNRTGGFCGQCRSAVPEESLFCPTCGAPLPSAG